MKYLLFLVPLYGRYLNMAPIQTLKWIDSGVGPGKRDVEIEGTEPYVVGGHTASGYWIGRDRQTTIAGLFAAGDVAGGVPQKYVTGALAEGEIAAEGILYYLKQLPEEEEEAPALKEQAREKQKEYERCLSESEEGTGERIYAPYEIETAMQKVMDEYAGGIRTNYRYNARGLSLARTKIGQLYSLLSQARVQSTDDLLALYEVRDRLVVSRVLIEHI